MNCKTTLADYQEKAAGLSTSKLLADLRSLREMQQELQRDDADAHEAARALQTKRARAFAARRADPELVHKLGPQSKLEGPEAVDSDNAPLETNASRWSRRGVAEFPELAFARTLNGDRSAPTVALVARVMTQRMVILRGILQERFAGPEGEPAPLTKLRGELLAAARVVEGGAARHELSIRGAPRAALRRLLARGCIIETPDGLQAIPSARILKAVANERPRRRRCRRRRTSTSWGPPRRPRCPSRWLRPRSRAGGQR